jgi:hypothetical protein
LYISWVPNGFSPAVNGFLDGAHALAVKTACQNKLCRTPLVGCRGSLPRPGLDFDPAYFNAVPRKYGQIIRPRTALQKGSPTKPIVNSQPINQISPPIVPVFADL